MTPGAEAPLNAPFVALIRAWPRVASEKMMRSALWTAATGVFCRMALSRRQSMDVHRIASSMLAPVDRIIKHFALSPHLSESSRFHKDHISADIMLLIVFTVPGALLVAAWTYVIHAIKGQSPNVLYTIAAGVSISSSYATSLFLLSRRNPGWEDVWQKRLKDFMIFEFSAALLLTISFTLATKILPHGRASPLWPGLFIRQAPISLIVFVAYCAFVRAVGAKRKANAAPTVPCLDDAILVEAQGNYVQVTTPAGSRMIRLTLAMAEQNLPMESYCRIHRSRIVRRDQIESVDWLDATVRLITGETVKASPNGLARLRGILP